MPTLSEDLAFRGLIHQVTDPALLKRLDAGGLTVYAGFDPTADSLHVGSMLQLCTLRRFQLAGHRPISLAGGGTGLIGDPGGKQDERAMLTKEVLEGYLAGIRPQLGQFLDLSDALLLDNSAWLSQLGMLEFLRDVGKHFTVNQMVAKDSVKTRFDRPDQGISYTEFSYMLLQAYDFFRLHVDHGCDLQIGGSDQWGNITAGIELTRKKLGKQVFGLTLPLITNADGTKFGKTEAGAIWLDPKRTSVYKFYQFWINMADADVIRYLKFFTFLTKEEIESLEKQHKENPGARVAHRRLAVEVTSMIHSDDAMMETVEASNILFGPIHQGLDEADATEYDLEKILKRAAKKTVAHLLFENIVGEIPTKEIEKSKLDGEGLPLVELLVHAGLCSSKGQARKDVESGGIYIKNVREKNFQRAVTASDLLFGKHILLRKGKKNYVVISAK
jgi:tyrosyl-tRNA synthetase